MTAVMAVVKYLYCSPLGQLFSEGWGVDVFSWFSISRPRPPAARDRYQSIDFERPRRFVGGAVGGIVGR